MRWGGGRGDHGGQWEVGGGRAGENVGRKMETTIEQQ